jgi:arginyl-tRNA synthetase
MIEDRLAGWLSQGLAGAAPALGLSGDLPTPELLAPKQKDHGDFATNVALGLAARAGRPPREVAQAIVDALPPASFVERVEIAGPGFINVFVTHDWLHEALRDVVKEGAAYGRGPRNGRRVQVEFVSANPTGPLHVGQARNAALGDAIARSLDAAGWDVHREYYFNDAGGQMDRFGASVVARYLQLAGVEADVPDDGYHGDYIAELARDIFQTKGWRACVPRAPSACWCGSGARSIDSASRSTTTSRRPPSTRRGRSPRPSSVCGRRATPTSPRGPCGSGPRRSATTRIAR